jgi:thiol-disulfide isomerase/thioredoxin
MHRYRLDDSYDEYHAILFAGHGIEYIKPEGMPLAEFMQTTIDGSAVQYNATGKQPKYIAPKKEKVPLTAAEEARKAEQAAADRGIEAAEKQRLVDGYITAPPAVKKTVAVVLTDQTYQALLHTGVWMVELGTSWCKHCTSLAPEYEAAAKALKKAGKGKGAAGKVRLGKVDCSSNEVDPDTGMVLSLFLPPSFSRALSFFLFLPRSLSRAPSFFLSRARSLSLIRSLSLNSQHASPSAFLLLLPSCIRAHNAVGTDCTPMRPADLTATYMASQHCRHDATACSTEPRAVCAVQGQLLPHHQVLQGGGGWSGCRGRGGRTAL